MTLCSAAQRLAEEVDHVVERACADSGDRRTGLCIDKAPRGLGRIAQQQAAVEPVSCNLRFVCAGARVAGEAPSGDRLGLRPCG